MLVSRQYLDKGVFMKIVDIIATVLLIVGGLNWGLVGAFDFDLVAGIFGQGSILARAVYSLVGLSAIYQAVSIKAIQVRWNVNSRMRA